jgi:ABC-type nickel/cobalt efflux system permease component RcnA
VLANARLVRRFFSAIAALSLILCPHPSSAHPMGNFSVSHYAGIRVGRGFVELRYLVDMAEIPTFQEIQKNSFVAQENDPRVLGYLSKQAEVLKGGLLMILNGQPLPLRIASQDIAFSLGAGNLPTMKLGLVYRAEVADACTVTRCELEYHDTNFSGRVGWKEIITSAGPGVTIENSSAPSHDRSSQLSNYPTDLINSAPQDVAAKIVYSAERAFGGIPSVAVAVVEQAKEGTSSSVTTRRRVPRGGTIGRPATAPMPPTPPVPENSGAIKLKPNQQSTPRNSFTELMALKHITMGMALLAAAIAAGLGALHALEPGHGKTIVATYLVGSKGTPRHALLLGMIVTISHTAGVYLLGAITLYAQKYILPDRIYPYLGVLSGMLVAGIGCYLFLQRYVGAEFAHSHSHESPSTARVSEKETFERRDNISARQLLILGVTGGIVPCPAALVVLLSAAALHRTGFGLFLIVAFSVGLAAVLIAMGLAGVYAGRMMSRLPLESPLLQRWLPMGSAVAIAALGCVIAVRGLMAAGIVQIRMWS